MSYIINYDKLVKDYTKLVYHLCNKIYQQNTNVDIDDLIQTGFETLIVKAKYFDPNKGYKFMSYIYPTLKRAIHREQVKQLQTIRIPTVIMDYLGLLFKAKKIYNNEEDIINYLKEYSKNNLTDYTANVLYNSRRLSTTVDIDEYCFDRIPNKSNTDMDNIITNQQSINLIKYCLNFLKPIEQKIIYKKYFSNENITLLSISKELDISLQRCSYLHKIAIKKIRKRVQSKLKEDFIYGV